MGLSLLGPGGTESIPIRASVEIGPGDIFVAVVLIYALAYLYLLDPLEIEDQQLRQIRVMLVAAVVPLLVAFIGIVLFTSIELV